MADTDHLKLLLNRLEETLVTAIPYTIQDMGVEEVAYCLFLVFHDTSVYDDFRPNLVVAPERLRRKLFESEPHAADIVWNPSHLDVYEMTPGRVTDGPGLKELCGEVYRILISNRHDECEEENVLAPVRSTMRRVAKRLNEFAWSQALNTTDDFVVVAIDDRGTDPQSDMNACVGPERTALLDSRGFLVNRTAECPACGEALRTPLARQCFHCGANWH